MKPVLDYRSETPVSATRTFNRKVIGMWLGLASCAMAALPFMALVHLLYMTIAPTPSLSGRVAAAPHDFVHVLIIRIFTALPLVGLLTGIAGLMCNPSSVISRCGAMFSLSMLGSQLVF